MNTFRFGFGALLVSAPLIGADPSGPAPSSIVSKTAPSALSDAASTPPTELDPIHVQADKLPGILGKVFGYSWNVSQLTQGSNFHIRHGELIDAIGARHLYLTEHPTERAIVVVASNPVDGRVTQAVLAYTKGNDVRLKSAALGDIHVSSMSPADLEHPEKIRRYIQEMRGIQTTHLDSVIQIHAGYDQTAIDKATGTSTVVPQGQLLAAAEETGDYRGVTVAGEPLYPGSPEDMLTSAFYWLNETDKVGLIPVSRATVEVDLTMVRVGAGRRAAAVPQDSVVFDWDGVHYLYNDSDGMLGMALPSNPVTGVPYLVLRNGDTLESIYFVATYLRLHPTELADLIPAADGKHAAAAFTQNGKLAMMSPFLGRFAVPARYHWGETGRLAQFHAALIAKEEAKLPAGATIRPGTGLIEAMPGDGGVEQVRRAYLAFQAIGMPVKFVQNPQSVAGLEIVFQGKPYAYFAPPAGQRPHSG